MLLIKTISQIYRKGKKIIKPEVALVVFGAHKNGLCDPMKKHFIEIFLMIMKWYFILT